MTALVVVTAAPVSLVGIAVTLGLAVLVAHWGAFRPQAKRLIAACVLALFLSTLGASILRADDGDFVMMNPCKLYEPWSLEWILLGCMLP